MIRVNGQTAMAYGQMRLPDFGVELITSALTHAPSHGEHPTASVLIARQQQAHLLSQQGHDAEAEAIYSEVLQEQLRVWPEDDPGNLAIRHNLAAVVGTQGR